MDDWATLIEDDLNWREAELTSLKVLITSSEKRSIRERALLRGLWILLYAHYEGFCKFAWDAYLDALERFFVPRSLLIDEIASFSLRKEFQILKGNLSDDQLWKFCSTDFISLLYLPATFKERLDTNSNLWPSLLKENCERICLEIKALDEHRPKLKALVSRRNEIAHGQKMVIKDLDEYMEYENAAMIIMHELAVNIIDAIEKKTFLKAI